MKETCKRPPKRPIAVDYLRSLRLRRPEEFVRDYPSLATGRLLLYPHKFLPDTYVTPIPPLLEGGISLVAVSHSVFDLPPALRGQLGVAAPTSSLSQTLSTSRALKTRIGTWPPGLGILLLTAGPGFAFLNVQKDLNLRPIALNAIALPTELCANSPRRAGPVASIPFEDRNTTRLHYLSRC